MKTAFITGITGQDGAYLARLLLDKGYKVHGMVQRCEVDNTLRLKTILKDVNLHLHEGDLTDGGNIFRLINNLRPDEIYNLGAQSHVGTSFQTPEYTANVDGLGVLRLLEAIRALKLDTKFYQASSSELFGNAPAPQDELTPLAPCSPYATAKLYAYWTVKNYRDSYGVHACNGILFNHESPWRGEDFVTRKVTKAAAEIAMGHRDDLSLGNLDAIRDWGHVRDYVEGMWRMLQQDEADDYVLATGRTYSVRDLVERAFAEIGRSIVWQGEGVQEQGLDRANGEVLIRIDPKYYRANEVHHLCGDASKARRELNWTPKTSFTHMIHEMVQADLKRLSPNWEEENESEFFKIAA